MKVHASIRRRCKDCQVIVRRSGDGKRVRRIVCVNPRHKQRQG